MILEMSDSFQEAIPIVIYILWLVLDWLTEESYDAQHDPDRTNWERR